MVDNLSNAYQGYNTLGCNGTGCSSFDATKTAWEKMGKGTFKTSDGSSIFNSENRDINGDGSVNCFDRVELNKNLDTNGNTKIDEDEAARVGSFYDYDGDGQISDKDKETQNRVTSLERETGENGKQRWVEGDLTEQKKENMDAYMAAEYGGSKKYNPDTPEMNYKDPQEGTWNQKMADNIEKGKVEKKEPEKKEESSSHGGNYSSEHQNPEKGSPQVRKAE